MLNCKTYLFRYTSYIIPPYWNLAGLKTDKLNARTFSISSDTKTQIADGDIYLAMTYLKLLNKRSSPTVAIKYIYTIMLRCGFPPSLLLGTLVYIICCCFPLWTWNHLCLIFIFGCTRNCHYDQIDTKMIFPFRSIICFKTMRRPIKELI